MPKHVALVGADLFSAYHDLARGLKQVGALVTGIGATASTAALPRRPQALARRLGAGGQPARPGEHRRRRRARAAAPPRPRPPRDRSTRTLVVPTAEARARARAARPLGAHRAALPRQAGDEGGAARGGPPLRRVDGGRLARRSSKRVRRARRLPADRSSRAPGSARIGAPSASTSAPSSSRAAALLGVDQRRSAAVEEWIEGHEGFFDTRHDRRRAAPRVHLALLPERAAGARRPRRLAADRRHQPRRSWRATASCARSAAR